MHNGRTYIGGICYSVTCRTDKSPGRERRAEPARDREPENEAAWNGRQSHWDREPGLRVTEQTCCTPFMQVSKLVLTIWLVLG